MASKKSFGFLVDNDACFAMRVGPGRVGLSLMQGDLHLKSQHRRRRRPRHGGRADLGRRAGGPTGGPDRTERKHRTTTRPDDGEREVAQHVPNGLYKARDWIDSGR
ncbi:MAG: hypothetical protein AB7F78_24475, partial [Hyphomicrobiaceae bacterium]